MTTELDLTALRDIAKAATEGDWTVGTDGTSENVYADWETEHGDYAKRVVKVGNRPDATHIAAFDPPTVLALLDRVEAAELWTVAHPCQVSHEQPYDFKWCETHDRTFPLDGDCDHKGKSALQWQDGREQEQRARALRAEGRAEAAEKAVAAVREALEAHPKACDRHTEDDPIKCGWKRAVADVSHALDGTAYQTLSTEPLASDHHTPETETP